MSVEKSLPRGLEGLPDAVLIRILEYLQSQRDVYHMCLVSRRINTVADPVL